MIDTHCHVLKEEYDNTIQLRLGGFDNLDEVWVSYVAAFSSRTTFAALPAPCGTGWATCVGNNAGAWAWSSKEGKYIKFFHQWIDFNWHYRLLYYNTTSKI